MNDRLNAPAEPRDDGTLQEDPFYQEPSEGIATGSGSGNASPDDEAASIEGTAS